MFSFLKSLETKSRILAGVFFILVVPLLLTLLLRSHSSRDLAVGFAGFRYMGGPHALFWVTNRTSEELWWIHHISLKADGVWKQDGKAYAEMMFLENIPSPESRGVIRLIAIPLSATNVPLRVVFYCREQIPVRDKVEEFYQQRLRKRSVYVANGRRYFVTNEVTPNQTRP
jgi:hypothetical protein